jgi:CheY-like chemotaxis protein
VVEQCWNAEMPHMSVTEIKKRAEVLAAPKCILFVEDNLDDFIGATIALGRIRLRNKIIRVPSADEMLAYLRGVDQFMDRDRYALPAAVIMDMRMPRKDGIEAQAMLRCNLRLRHLPIIAISSSENVEQLKNAVELGADAWMLKPFSADQFTKIARELNLDIEYDSPVTTAPTAPTNRAVA